MRAGLVAALLSVAAPPVLAAPAAAADRDFSLYQIEVLVFENRQPDLIGDELLSRDAGAALQRALDAAEAPATTGGQPYLLPVVSTQLVKDGHYRILAHAHWQQALEANPKTPVKPVRIPPVATARAGEIEGAVRFNMSRFLHLDVNMRFRETAGDGASPALYQINEQRRIKSQETHYFDHPKFGVLVRVLPVESGSRGGGQRAR